jgi:cytochrome c553
LKKIKYRKLNKYIYIKGFKLKLKLAISALFLVSLSFVGCGGDDKAAAHSAPAAEAPKPAAPAPAAEEAPAPVKEVKAEAPAAAPVAAADGATLFKKCAACHGANAEKSALGKSQVIAGWDATKVADALKGYKAGTYGGAMAGLMKGQVATLSDADIQALAEYISSK